MFRSAIIGACTGLATALLVLGYPHLERHFRVPVMDERLIIGICPPSLILWGLAGQSSLLVFFIVCSIVVLYNSVWYSFWFMIATLPFTKSARRKIRLNIK
jgi:hypothetical protein